METITAETIQAIKSVILKAGKIALEGRARAEIKIKSDHTPYTDVELAIEKAFIDFIQQNFPGDQIISEEKGIVGEKAERIWVLDPIDGTRAYINGLPTWGISLGLLAEGEPELGFFYMPKCDDFYWGGQDFGAFLNDRPLASEVTTAFDDPQAFLAVPSNFHLHYQTRYPRVRSVGSTAANLCYTALGSAVGTLTRHISLWDIAGMLPILDHCGVTAEFMNGDCLIPSNHTDGKKFTGELLFAAPQNMKQVHEAIQYKF
jgi:myo-inositol-1(or 4)-monophosphatase